MCDDDDRSVFDQVTQRSLYEHFRFGVEVGSGLIEDQDGRVFQQGPRNGKALALASAELGSSFSDDGIVRLRQARNKIFCHRVSRGFLNFFERRIGTAIPEVIHDGSVEQECLLGNDADLRPERLDGEIANVLTVDADGPRRYFLKPRNEIGKRRFARSTWANQRYDFASLHARG